MRWAFPPSAAFRARPPSGPTSRSGRAGGVIWRGSSTAASTRSIGDGPRTRSRWTVATRSCSADPLRSVDAIPGPALASAVELAVVLDELAVDLDVLHHVAAVCALDLDREAVLE